MGNNLNNLINEITNQNSSLNNLIIYYETLKFSKNYNKN